jgi:NAD(P)-dependent dehydrogenase (short-subunit alcohol dehydrogenase family)
MQLAASGCRVAISGRTLATLEEVASHSPLISVFPVDVTDLNGTKQTADRIVAQLGPIDLAILNAGVWYPHAQSSGAD